MRNLSVVHAVRSDAFAGVERYVVTAARALEERGHRMTVIGGDPATMPSQLGDRIAYHPAATTLGVARTLQRVGPVDVVHAHMTAAELAAVMVAPRLGARAVATRHFARPRGASIAGRAVGVVVARRLDAQVAISQYVAGSCGGCTSVIPNAVPDAEPVDPVAPVVVVVQRLEAEKNTPVVVEAWAASGLGDEGWELRLVGDGAQRPVLEALASFLGVTPSVRFLGRRDDIAELRRAAAFQVAPQPDDGFGLSVLEAMAAGLPVVAADGGGHREILDGFDELLVGVASPSPLAAKMRWLARDVDRRRALGARLRQRQQQHYGVEQHVVALEDLYEQVLR